MMLIVLFQSHNDSQHYVQSLLPFSINVNFTYTTQLLSTWSHFTSSIMMSFPYTHIYTFLISKKRKKRIDQSFHFKLKLSKPPITTISFAHFCPFFLQNHFLFSTHCTAQWIPFWNPIANRTTPANNESINTCTCPMLLSIYCAHSF